MILVTGASGLVGSHLVQSLLRQCRPVKALYRSAIPSFPDSDKVQWLKGDILEVDSLEDALSGIKQVYHCAGLVSYQPGDQEKLYKTNVEGTANVVNAALLQGVKKLLHVSSVAALGQSKKDIPIDESNQWSAAGSSEYGKSKHLAEMEVWRGIGEGLQAVIVNPSIILGAGDWNSGSSQIFKTVYEEFPWYTDGITGFVDVDDVVTACIRLMESSILGERFILNAENARFKEVFDAIADGFGKQKPSKKVTPLLASLIWRTEAIRSKFSGKKPLLTKETSTNAQNKVYFNGSKLLNAIPDFHYKSLRQSIEEICFQYRNIYNLQ